MARRMTAGSAPSYMVHGEPPGSPEEALADDWDSVGFTVLTLEEDPLHAVWLRCQECGAHVHASAATGHVGDRCVVRNPDGEADA